MSERYEEICRQPYPNDKFIAAGIIHKDDVERIYLEFGGGRIIEMRVDEAASVIWALGGSMYSALLKEQEDDD